MIILKHNNLVEVKELKKLLKPYLLIVNIY